MKKYAICETADREYAGFLMCLTYESLFDYLNCIEEEPLLSHSKGTLLIDQLLITGNGQNRYLICPFSNGTLLVSSAKNVSPSQYYRRLSLDLLKENSALLSNSILTDKQRELIKAGIPF